MSYGYLRFRDYSFLHHLPDMRSLMRTKIGTILNHKMLYMCYSSSPSKADIDSSLYERPVGPCCLEDPATEPLLLTALAFRD